MWFNATMTVPLPVRSLNLEALTSGRDPAVASGPLMSTFMDLIGVVAYFGVALVLLF